MIGLRVGPRSGRTGLAVGPGEDELHAYEATTLSVSIADSIDPAITFGLYSYAVVVTNLGTPIALGLVVVITLDAQTTFISGSGTGWSVANVAGTITCTRSGLATGAAPTITINVRASATAETSVCGVRATAMNAPIPVTDSENTTVETVSFDSTAQVFVPANSTEWSRFRAFFSLTAAAPTSLHLCQESSGNLADSIGAVPLTANGTPLYNQTASGWSRLGVAGDDGTADFFGTLGGGNITTTSQMWMFLVRLSVVPAANRAVGGPTQHGFTTGARIILSGNKLSNQCVGAFTSGTFVHTVGSYAIFKKYDRTTAEDFGGDQNEFLSTVYGAGVVNASHGIMNNVSSLGGCQYVYVMRWDGAPAEMTQAQVRSLIQALGFTVAW